MKIEHKDHPYVESGLSNVILLGIEIRTCPKCGEVERVIPRLAQLHRVIAIAVAEQPEKLIGAEVRYLCKTLGWSGEAFAATFGVRQETVSRWENDKEPMGSTAERLLRLAALREKPISEYPTERLKDVGKEGKPRRLNLRAASKEWRYEAA
jgi:putative zinc finger/helix-turn-helix YgiT family protein